MSVRKHGGSYSVTDAAQGKPDECFGQPARRRYPRSGLEQQASGLVIVGCGAAGDVTIPVSQGQDGARDGVPLRTLCETPRLDRLFLATLVLCPPA